MARTILVAVFLSLIGVAVPDSAPRATAASTGGYTAPAPTPRPGATPKPTTNPKPAAVTRPTR